MSFQFVIDEPNVLVTVIEQAGPTPFRQWCCEGDQALLMFGGEIGLLPLAQRQAIARIAAKRKLSRH